MRNTKTPHRPDAAQTARLDAWADRFTKPIGNLAEVIQAEVLAATDYYTLLTRDDRASPWQIAFGDYSRADVMSERADLLEHDHRRINTTVIRTAPDQASIDRVVACLNAARKA
jgi:hypothetical protein